jgi:drug/metabolite transporter (DMT)-like permease
VTGVLWAAASGIGFGLFQSLNAQAVREVDDVYVSTFLQLLVAALVLVGVCLVTEDVGRLAHAPAWALASFALAGGLHFLVGWTLLNMSQARIGAARSSPLLTMTPMFGVAIAAVTLGELPGAAALGAIALMVLGAYVLSAPGSGLAVRWQDSLFGLGTAFMWALSPIFTLEGLDGLDSPLLGVAVGLTVSVAGYGIVLSARRPDRPGGRLPRSGIALKLTAGVIVALATWGRWESLDLTTVGVVLALNLLAVPVVLLLAPIIVGRHIEQVTARVWVGALLVVGGSLVLIALGG